MNNSEAYMCPICGDSNAKRIVSLALSDLCECHCSHRFVSFVSDLPANLKGIYQSEEYAGFVTDPVFQRTIREELITNFCPRIRPSIESHILDVGCGNGDFLAAAQELHYDATGVDISPTAVTKCINRGLNALVDDFINLQLDVEYDFITMWDVIEHIPDPRLFVRRAFQLLKPGRYLVVKTPYVADQTFLIVRAFPQLARLILQVPEHIQFFNRRTLQIVLQQSGFDHLEWLPDRPMRSSPPARTVKKVVARHIGKFIGLLGKNGNLFVIARKPV